MEMNANLASRNVGKRKVLHPKPETEGLGLGALLRTLREKKGVGLRELARKIGVSAPYLSNVERGKSPAPSEGKLRAIAGILHANPELLTRRQPSEVMVLDPECGTAETLGAALRTLRLEMGIGLREFADKIGISAPYLSNIERGKLPPPSEEKLCAIAGELNQDPDELLAKAGKTASDLLIIINKYPREFAAILRSMRNLDESHFPVLVNGLAKQFHAIMADPPYAKTQTREKKTRIRLPINWELLRETFAGESLPKSAERSGYWLGPPRLPTCPMATTAERGSRRMNAWPRSILRAHNRKVHSES